MSFLNDRFDIFSQEQLPHSHSSSLSHLNEELSLDDLFTASDTRSQDVLADKANSQSEHKKFEHFMNIQFTMPTDSKTPERIKRALLNFIPEYIKNEIFPLLEQCRHISSFEVGWANMESLSFTPDSESEQFYPLAKSLEFFTTTPNALTGRRLHFVVMFNVRRPERLRHIFSILNTLYNVNKRFSKLMSGYSSSIDNWPSFILSSEVMDDINRGQYSSTKNEKAIKHFVDIFTKSKKTKKELSEYMSPRENYLGTGQDKFQTHVAFLDGTWRNVIFSPSDVESQPKNPIAFIPEGKTARCRYSFHDTFVKFRVAGTLIIWHRYDLKGSAYNGFHNDCYGLRRLDPVYHHNNIVIEIEFDTYPDVNRDDKIAIMVHDRYIDNLIIRADDRFLEDINHLKELVDLQDIKNVGNIEWEFKEDD